MAPPNFRDHLRAPDDPRIAGIAALDARGWARRMLDHPRAGPLFARWRALYAGTEFTGITSDGTTREGLYPLRDEGAPVLAMVQAAQALLAACSDAQRALLCHDLRAREWRAWMNPEVYMHPFGLRLEECGEPLRERILAVLRASLSDSGYARARDLMRINHFLGELVGGSGVMNEWSYNFNLFGTPSPDAPWGWNFYGHHLCLNCLVLGGQMVLTPVFMGAEPNVIDTGPHAGTRAFIEEEALGLALMRSLDEPLRRQARLYQRVVDPAMPAGRVALGDERMLAGAFQDNRVLPPEGARAAAMGETSRALLLRLLRCYLAFLPGTVLDARMADLRAHLDDTWLCWIGGLGDDDPFYYRIQSPVIVMEFDHHAGVFLANAEPARFHVHTLVRTPNGNDYGMALVRQHCECVARAARALAGKEEDD